MTKAGGLPSTRQWFSAAEIVAVRAPELPGTVRGFNMLAAAEGWRSDPARARQAARRDRGWEYHVSVLPPAAQTRLLLAHSADDVPPAPAELKPASRDMWGRFEALSKAQKERCERRLQALVDIDALIAAGTTVTAAIARVADVQGVSQATLHNWRKMVAGVDRADWLPALAADYRPTATAAECHPEALNVLISDWLRPSRPSFSACYRRMRKAASAKGWLPIPSERALRRRVEKEVPRSVATLARDGRDRAKTLYPAQRRTRTALHAMQAVNMDGHKLDVFVAVPWSKRPVRMHLLALQDLYSGKIVAWRLSDTENKATVRLVIGDMVERHGIPEKIVLDNGRAFASKWISGGAPNRYRFTVRDEEPQGLLTTLGIEIVWTQPYSGQSKPIERAFRDLAEEVAKHPLCAGAYTGNRPDAKPEDYASRAVPLDAFRDHVAREIAEHNGRAGRRTATCAGRSFDETFAESLQQPSTLVRWPSEGQKALWLLAADRVRAQRGSGEIHLFGNRYWSRELNQFAGQSVTVRFDPEDLHQPLRVYDQRDSLICAAGCIDDTGFFDAEGAQRTARDRAAFIKTQREHERLRDKLSADELARIFGADEKPAEPAPEPPRVKKIAAGGAHPLPAAVPDEDFETSFSRGLQRLRQDAEVIPFQPERKEAG